MSLGLPKNAGRIGAHLRVIKERDGTSPVTRVAPPRGFERVPTGEPDGTKVPVYYVCPAQQRLVRGRAERAGVADHLAEILDGAAGVRELGRLPKSQVDRVLQRVAALGTSAAPAKPIARADDDGGADWEVRD